MNADDDELACRIYELVAAELDGTATPAEQAALKSLLSNNPAARRLYVECIQETASLRWSFSRAAIPIDDGAGINKPRRSNARPTSLAGRQAGGSRRWRSFVALAASLLIGLGLFALATKSRQEKAPTLVAAPKVDGHAAEAIVDRSTRGVATLIRATNAVWEEGEELAELTRLDVGQAIALRSGQVEMSFDAGVEVVVNGPAHFEVRSAESAYSSRGAISVRVGPDGDGFTIDTPSTRVIDIGTEFGVAVNEAGETEVAVFRGIVDLAYGDGPVQNAAVRQRLNQGEAIRVGVNGSLDRVTSITSDRFPVSAALRAGDNPREPIIADVTDNIRAGDSNKFYRIVRTGLHDDSPAFVDRSHQWNAVDKTGLPLDLEGAEYVMPFNDDKFLEGLETSIEIARPATLYIFYSDKMELPEWLVKDFEDTGVDVGLDESKSIYNRNYKLGVGPGESIDNVFSIWKREIHQPGIVRLGSVKIHRFSPGYSMYGIATTPLDTRTK